MKRGRKKKFNDSEVREIKWYYRETEYNISAIARVFRTTPTTIARVIDRKPPYDTEGEIRNGLA